jgi:hypothetical protein
LQSTFGQEIGQKLLTASPISFPVRGMTTATPSKPGREQKHHVTAKGKTIVGLSRRPDGRWRVIGTQQTFRETDEEKAVARFYELTDAP